VGWGWWVWWGRWVIGVLWGLWGVWSRVLCERMRAMAESVSWTL